jgi:hypothetical protein
LPAILSSQKTGTRLLALPTAATLGALGIVYGDIGTSPLYAFRAAIKVASVDGSATPEAVLGAISLIIWSLILVVSLKYAILILRAAGVLRFHSSLEGLTDRACCVPGNCSERFYTDATRPSDLA